MTTVEKVLPPIELPQLLVVVVVGIAIAIAILLPRRRGFQIVYARVLQNRLLILFEFEIYIFFSFILLARSMKYLAICG